jgi:hypothetical protein
MWKIFYLIVFITLYGPNVILAQETRNILFGDYKNMSCRLEEEDGGSMLGMDGKPLGSPVIWGNPVTIPSFRLRIIDDKTAEPLKAEKVSILYGWKWLEYPSPEHLWGAWEDAGDELECNKIEMDELTFPQFEVKPRGWYKGKYSKEPFFDGITIVIRIGGCQATADIKSQDAKSLAGKTIVVKAISGINGCSITKISYIKTKKDGMSGDIPH